jgi:hypothetical protein
MASLTDVQVGLLVDNARPDFKSKGYGRAAVEKKVDGAFILEANEVELSMMFSKMNVDPVDMPALRQAVSSWKANPAQVFSCINQAAQRAAAAEAQRRRDAEAAAAMQAQLWRNAQAAAANLGRYADPRKHVVSTHPLKLPTSSIRCHHHHHHPTPPTATHHHLPPPTTTAATTTITITVTTTATTTS